MTSLWEPYFKVIYFFLELLFGSISNGFFVGTEFLINLLLLGTSFWFRIEWLLYGNRILNRFASSWNRIEHLFLFEPYFTSCWNRIELFFVEIVLLLILGTVLNSFFFDS